MLYGQSYIAVFDEMVKRTKTIIKNKIMSATSFREWIGKEQNFILTHLRI